jgi:hypothetical protein
MFGMVFWLVGLDAPVIEDTFYMHFKILKISKNLIYIQTFYIHVQSFAEKLHIFWPM